MYSHDFSLTTSKTTPVYVNAAGKYVRYVSASESASNPAIRVKTDNGFEIDMLPGRGVTLPQKFGQLRLTNKDGVSQIKGVLLVGDGEMQDSRVSGEVLMTDGTYVRSLQVSEFFAPVVVGAVVGQAGHAQLWNQVGTSRNLFVHRVRAQLEAAGTSKMRLSQYNAGLAVVGAPPPKFINASPSGVLAEIRTGSNAAPLGTPLLYDVMTFGGRVLEFASPIIVPQGWGLFVICETLNTAFSVTFEYYHMPA